MELLLTGLVLTVIVGLVVPLAVLRAGISRQHRAASLTCQPPSFSARVARRVFGLYARTPDTTDRCGPAHREPSVISRRRNGAS
jgi:hypothetical protein